MVQAKGDPVPAITEAAAEGETAELFADLRETLGVPVVNLVWRHLATFPGGLAWAWRSVRPVYVSGQVAAAADVLKSGLSLPHLPALPHSALALAGLEPADVSGIARVLASYDRSNAINYLALTALLMPSDAASVNEAAGHIGPVAAPLLEGGLPPLSPLDQLPTDVLDMVTRLNALGENGEAGLVVSMYRHLAHWPASLPLVWGVLAPAAADGRLAVAAESVEAEARPFAAALAGILEAPTERPVLAREALERFMAHVRLPKMIAITGMLRAVFPAQP